MTRAPRSSAGSLRFRLTAIATVAVALVLSLTALALLTMQRRQLTANLDASLEQRADTIAGVFASDISTTLVNGNDEDRAVQLVSADGHVLASTSNLLGQPSLGQPSLGASLPPAAVDGADFATRRDLPLEDDSYRVHSRWIQTPEGPAVLHVAENSDDLDDAVRNLTIALATTIPAVVVILAGLMWWLTGRTLGPVDRMRAQVDSITATDSDARVHVSPRDDEISRLGTTMNRMLDRLTEATERQRRFVADAAHELRTPLTRIRTNLDIDLAQPDNADPTETLRGVRQEAIDLQHLIDDLLHLARSDAGQTPHHRELVDLDDLVMREIQDLRASIANPEIDSSNVSAAQVNGNPAHLGRAVRNLLHNAARYARSSVTVDLAELPQGVELSITDDGPGIAADQQEGVFERFTRIQDARTRQDGGTGLGLAITRDIVEDHRGSIHYDAEHIGGARFVVRLPLPTDQMPDP